LFSLLFALLVNLTLANPGITASVKIELFEKHKLALANFILKELNTV